MTTTQRDALATPLKGAIIYNTDEDCLQINVGTLSIADWGCINGGSVSATSGNSWFVENTLDATTNNNENAYHNSHVGIGDFSAATVDYPLHIKTTTSSVTSQFEAANPSIILKELGTSESASIAYSNATNSMARQQALEIKNQNGGRINFFTASSNLQEPDLTLAADGRVGIGTSSPDNSVALHVAGDILATGSDGSDKRFKKEIRPLDNALEIVQAINGVRYQYRAEEFPEMKFNTRPQVGVIAQEVEVVLPEVVHTMENGYKAVKYEKLTPLLLEAIKELHQQQVAFQKELTLLKEENLTLKRMLKDRVSVYDSSANK